MSRPPSTQPRIGRAHASSMFPTKVWMSLYNALPRRASRRNRAAAMSWFPSDSMPLCSRGFLDSHSFHSVHYRMSELRSSPRGRSTQRPTQPNHPSTWDGALWSRFSRANAHTRIGHELLRCLNRVIRRTFGVLKVDGTGESRHNPGQGVQM